MSNTIPRKSQERGNNYQIFIGEDRSRIEPTPILPGGYSLIMIGLNLIKI